MGRVIVLFFALTAISIILLISLALWNGSSEGIEEIKETYGGAFVVTPAFPLPDEGNKAYSPYWEPIGEESEEYRYIGPLLDTDMIKEIRTVSGINNYCVEQTMDISFQEMDFLPGIHASTMEKIQEGEESLNEDEPYDPAIAGKTISPKGYNKSELSTYFRTNAFEVKEGRHIQEGDQNKAIISDALAERNNLHLGDTIQADINDYTVSLGDKDRIYWEKDLEIIGIFHVNTYQIISDYMAEQDIAENFIFTDLNVMQDAKKEYFSVINYNKEPSFYKVTFFVNDPENLQKAMKEAKQIEEIQWQYFYMEPDDTMYQSALKPLQNIRIITMVLSGVTMVVSLILLFLMLRIWIGGRQKEIGILYSLGETKGRITVQFMSENLLILCMALIFSILIASQISEEIGGKTLQAMNTRLDKKYGEAEEVELTDAKDLLEFNEQFQVSAEVDSPEKINTNLSLKTVLIASMLSVTMVILATVISIVKMLRLKPKYLLTDLI